MYKEFYIKFNTGIDEETADIVIAYLGQLNFESFENVEDGVKAYIKKEDISEQELEEQINLLKALFEFTVLEEDMPEKNWNEVWEKDYEPVIVNDKCAVVAPFHKLSPEPPYLIKIEPKMAFGTGHHETTFLILNLLFDLKVSGKRVCDAGTGSGVLSILAHQLGAGEIFAYDIDEWSYQNTKENFKVNKVKQFTLKKSDASVIAKEKFDLILANINRNILLKDVVPFSKSLEKKGKLVVSGFYLQDLKIILSKFEKRKLELVKYVIKNNWVAAVFQKR